MPPTDAGQRAKPHEAVSFLSQWRWLADDPAVIKLDLDRKYTAFSELTGYFIVLRAEK
jgi:hypothetical protein